MKTSFFHKVFAALTAIFFACIVTSCHDEEVANIQELAYRHNYESNFVKHYGEISPDQTWDFSSYARGKRNISLTRADGESLDFGIPTITADDGKQIYLIPDSLIRWINTNVAQEHGSGVIHDVVDADLIHAFSFEADPDDVFDVLPFYMTTSDGSVWHLEMMVVHQDDDGNVTSKESFRLWSPNDQENGTGVYWSSNKYSGYKEEVGSESSEHGGSGWGGTENAAHLASRPFRIDFSKYGVTKPNTVVYFYVYVSHGHAQINSTGDTLTSITHKPNLVAIDLPPEYASLTNQNGYDAMLIGVENGNSQGSGNHGHNAADFDYNDLMLLFVGKIPDIYYDEMLQTTTIKKRYMIEDLYGYDYDFNDIVVDVTQTDARYYIVNEENGIKTEEEKVIDGKSYPIFEQVATIVHECGTLPYQIKVGNFTFGQVTDPTDVDLARSQLDRAADAFGGPVTVTVPMDYQGNEPNFSKTGNLGWKPDQNNITAFIWTKGSDGEDPTPSKSYSYTHDGLWTGAEGIWVSTFPEQGAVPYIIAVDQNVVWMREFKHIPTNWLGGDMSTDSSTTSTEEYISSH